MKIFSKIVISAFVLGTFWQHVSAAELKVITHLPESLLTTSLRSYTVAEVEGTTSPKKIGAAQNGFAGAQKHYNILDNSPFYLATLQRQRNDYEISKFERITGTQSGRELALGIPTREVLADLKFEVVRAAPLAAHQSPAAAPVAHHSAAHAGMDDSATATPDESENDDNDDDEGIGVVEGWQNFAKKHDILSPDIQKSKSYWEALRRKIGWKEEISPRMKAFNALGISNFVEGNFLQEEGRPLVHMSFSTAFYLKGDIKKQKSNLLYIYRDFLNKLMMPRGDEMLLEVLNRHCYKKNVTGENILVDSRNLMDKLIGARATVVLEEDSSVTGLDKMRLELLEKYFNKNLVDRLVEFLKDKEAGIKAQYEAEDDADADKKASNSLDAYEARDALYGSLNDELGKLEGVHTGLKIGEEYAFNYLIEERKGFTLQEMRSLKREMEKIESIPFSYATMLKHTMKVAAITATTAAAGYGAYQYYQGNLDPAIDMTKKFIMETLPASFTISNLTKQATSMFDSVVSRVMPRIESFFEIKHIAQGASSVVDTAVSAAGNVTSAVAQGASSVATNAAAPLATVKTVAKGAAVVGSSAASSFFDGGGWSELGSQVGEVAKKAGAALYRGAVQLEGNF